MSERPKHRARWRRCLLWGGVGCAAVFLVGSAAGAAGGEVVLFAFGAGIVIGVYGYLRDPDYQETDADRMRRVFDWVISLLSRR